VTRRASVKIVPVRPPGVVVCVLGCPIGTGALERRARAASAAFAARRAELLIACGGRAWAGRVEADELARMLEEGGVPSGAIVRERASLDTFENAACAASILGARGVRDVVLVTCSWHLPRATRHFRRAGLAVEGLGVAPPDPTRLQRAYWTVREALSTLKDARRPMRVEGPR
jgi:uncharacterized SAM-binding protein YcdF (DUF218 family)